MLHQETISVNPSVACLPLLVWLPLPGSLPERTTWMKIRNRSYSQWVSFQVFLLSPPARARVNVIVITSPPRTIRPESFHNPVCRSARSAVLDGEIVCRDRDDVDEDSQPQLQPAGRAAGVV